MADKPLRTKGSDDWRDMSATRMSLLDRLGNWEDQVGWQRFFEKYNRLLFLWAVKAGLSEDESEEAMQNTVIAVAKALREGQFQRRGDGSFKAWLYGVARHRILDQFRSREARGAVMRQVLEFPEDAELERLWDAEWAGHRIKLAAAMACEKVSPRQYQIFELYVLREWPVDAIRKTLNVSRAQIYMAKVRVGSVFKEMLAQVDE